MSDAATVETWSGKDRGDENFPVGSVLIRRDLRAHVHAYYSFARNADDIADSPVLTPEDKVARLDVMEAVLLGLTDDGSPSAARLRASLAATGVSAVHATDLLVAFRRDAIGRGYADWRDLQDYCRYSAMPVGRYVLELHREGRTTWGPSDALCTSLQVLNHLQDCAGDLAELGRCYLPGHVLARYGATIEDLHRPAATPALRAVFDALLDRVDDLNVLGRDLPRRVRGRRLRLETAMIVGLAHRLAARLRKGDPIARRVKVTRIDAILAGLGALGFLR